MVLLPTPGYYPLAGTVLHSVMLASWAVRGFLLQVNLNCLTSIVYIIFLGRLPFFTMH